VPEAEIVSGAPSRMGRSTPRRFLLSEKKKYRAWTVAQKLEIVLAGLRGEMSVAEVCREHQISETLFYGWREKLLEGADKCLSGKEERHRGGGAAQARA
jgi:transposase-like protein